MQIAVDTHTHTILSGHAHSTIIENAKAAAQRGLKGMVITDHGPALEAAPPEYNIDTYVHLPRHIEGVKIFHGIETNIVDFIGSLDVAAQFLKNGEYLLAGLHEVVIGSGGRTKDTDTLLGAINNPYIDAISHPDNPSYDVDYEALIKETVRLGKIIEINNRSYQFRVGSVDNANKIMRLCKKFGARIAVSSDAHSAFEVGRYKTAIKLLAQNDFPSELIVNLTLERFEKYVEEKKTRLQLKGLGCK